MKKFVIVLLCLIALAGCGGGGGVSAPTGSTITINPATISVTDLSSSVRWSDPCPKVTAIVANSDGQRLGDIKISIFSQFGTPPKPDPTTNYVVQLFNQDGTAVSSPFDAKTDNMGTYTFTYCYQSGGGVKFTDSLEIRSSGAYQKVAVSIQ